MAQRWDRMADHGEMARVLWPEPDATPVTPLPGDATFLRMYPPGQSPRPGSLRADHLEMDSHWHFHDMHQLFFTFEGAIELEAADGSHLISQQLAAWIPAEVAHRASLHGTPSVSIFFPGDTIANPCLRIRSLIVTPLMREMMRETARWPLHGPETAVRRSFYAALGALCEEWIESQETGLFLPACEDPRLQRALDYTARHADAKLAEVCTEAGMSERTLRRHFRAETGLTWEAYRQRSRLLQAIALLSDTAEQVTEIAAQCGFESPSAFAKAFRAAMGEAPSDYRSRMARA